MLTVEEQAAVDYAVALVQSKIVVPTKGINGNESAKALFQLMLSDKEQEVFAVAFLNNQHQIIEVKEMFFGTVDAAAVYPREIIKQGLLLNASALLLAHNHPSGTLKASRADEVITQRIATCADLFDIRILDHIIVTASAAVTFHELGLENCLRG